jgi:hypothetical protein
LDHQTIKKMNWGKATIVILTVFVLFIGGMSFYMFRAPKDDYDHQYYENGLNFDRDYNREAQVVKDHAQPLIVLNGNKIKFTFAEHVKGKIKFMRPSDNLLDKAFTLNSDTGREQEISLDKFPSGQWQLVMEWESNHKAYLYHKEIYIK